MFASLEVVRRSVRWIILSLESISGDSCLPLKNKAATVSVSFSDMFKTRKQDQHSESIYFIQDYYRLNNPQMVRVNFSYRFGKMDISLFKRQNTKSTGTQDAMQMGQ